MCLGVTLGAGDARGHGPLDDQRVRLLLGERTADVDVEGVEILAHGRFRLQAVAGQGPGQVVAGHVVLRVARDRDIVVVDEDLHIQLLGDRQARRFGVVAFHLGAVGAEHDDRLVRVRHGDAIAKCPEVAEAAGSEFDAGRQTLFRVAGQATVELAIVQQLFRRHRAVQDAQQILRRDAVARFIVEDRHDGRATGDEGTDDGELRNGVVGAARVTGQALGAGQCREEHDRVAAQLNIVLERRFLSIRQRGDGGVELQRLQLAQINRKGFGAHMSRILMQLFRSGHGAR